MAKNTKKMKDLAKNKKVREEPEVEEPEVEEPKIDKVKIKEKGVEPQIMEDPFPNKELLRYDEVARFWNVDVRTIRLWVDHGHLKMVLTPSKQPRIPKESCFECLIAQKVEFV